MAHHQERTARGSVSGLPRKYLLLVGLGKTHVGEPTGFVDAFSFPQCIDRLVNLIGRQRVEWMLRPARSDRGTARTGRPQAEDN
jgi:hypothetical protein